MSLTRVSSIDQFERDAPTAGFEHRRMSFNPVTDWIPPKKGDEPPTAASVLEFEEVSKTKRLGELRLTPSLDVCAKTVTVQVAIAIVYCLFAAGIVFGYAAIKPVLISEGAFDELCTAEELKSGVTPCYQQELRLNLMFTVAAVSTNVAALPIGTVLDRYGPRVCGIISSILLFIGALLFSFASRISGDAYTPAYFFLALGGPFVFISSFQLSNAFPQRSGLILALLTGAFDSSSALFLLFRVLYQKTGGSLNTENLFKFYLVVPIFILLVQIFVMPAKSYKSVSEVVKEVEDEINAPTPPEISIEERLSIRERRESAASEIQALLDRPNNTKRVDRQDKKNKTSGVWGAMHGHSAWEQIKSPWFILITLFTVVQMTRINYFVATIKPQERWLLGSEKEAQKVNEFFDIALPVGGVLSIPFIGTILDGTSTPFALASLVVVATIIGVLGCLPYTWAAIANIVLFVLYRPFYYTAVSDYSAKVFGFVTFGKVYGLIICLAGLLNFVQSPLDAMTIKVFKRNPIPVNAMLTGLALIVGTILVTFTYVRSRSMEREKLEDEAEGATERLMPEPNGNGAGYGT
jgi:MFS family permease